MTLKGLRVLVVEDESLICTMIEEFLSDFGCHVVASADDLEDALLKATTLAMDVAVLDINLHGKLSYPVAHRLSLREIPFLFATGYGVAALPPELKSVPVLPKPFGMPQLEKALYLATGNNKAA